MFLNFVRRRKHAHLPFEVTTQSMPNRSLDFRCTKTHQHHVDVGGAGTGYSSSDGSCTGQLMITGVMDGDGTLKVIELFALDGIAYLSDYGVGSADNGGGSDGEEFTFPSNATAAAGDFIYVVSPASNFTAFFGFTPTLLYVDFVADIADGNDAIELFFDGTAVDVFGDISFDIPDNEPWDYNLVWTYHLSGGPVNNFTLAEWTFSGREALDGESKNSEAATPFPIGNFTLPNIMSSSEPSAAPSTSAMPSVEPSAAPSTSSMPSGRPSAAPTASSMPSSEPSATPSSTPSVAPSTSSLPSSGPSSMPSTVPSGTPSTSSARSTAPSAPPSSSVSPSQSPSGAPSASPSQSREPSSQPSVSPSSSSLPSGGPRQHPSILPSEALSASPSEPPGSHSSQSSQTSSSILGWSLWCHTHKGSCAAALIGGVTALASAAAAAILGAIAP